MNDTIVENKKKQEIMQEKAKAAVLVSGRWLTAPQIAEMSCKYDKFQPNIWKENGEIFSIKSTSSAELFPAYSLDPSKNFRPLKAMSQIIEILTHTKDGWGMAYWFASVNSFLGGVAPQEVLTHNPDRVIAAAAHEIMGITHG